MRDDYPAWIEFPVEPALAALPSLSGAEVGVLLVMIATSELAKLAGLSDRSFRRALLRLIDRGLLGVTP